jgi:hypothetical protein
MFRLARFITLKLTGFDLLHSPQFLEHWFLHRLGARPERYGAAVDGWLPDGRSVEIKTTKNRQWSRLNLQADLNVLVLVDNDRLLVWYFSRDDLPNAHHVSRVRTFPEPEEVIHVY